MQHKLCWCGNCMTRLLPEFIILTASRCEHLSVSFLCYDTPSLRRPFLCVPSGIFRDMSYTRMYYRLFEDLVTCGGKRNPSKKIHKLITRPNACSLILSHARLSCSWHHLSMCVPGLPELVRQKQSGCGDQSCFQFPSPRPQLSVHSA